MNSINVLDKALTNILKYACIVLGIYLQFSGTSSVGGGFQAGCIFGSLTIFIATVI